MKLLLVTAATAYMSRNVQVGDLFKMHGKLMEAEDLCGQDIRKAMKKS